VELNHLTGGTGLFMVDKLGTHLLFDPVTFKEQSAIEVSANPHDFAFSADHRLAYVPIYGDGVYGRIRIRAGSVSWIYRPKGLSAPWTSRPTALHTVSKSRATAQRYLHPTAKCWSSSQGSRVKDAIDPEGTGHWMAILPDASKMYVANKNDKPFISVLDLKPAR
jgi:hypothetical protein